MPDWCENKLILSGSEAQINSLYKKIKEDGLLQTLRPMPDAETLKKWDEERKGEKWYPWGVENWGTKWEEDELNLELVDGTLEAYFNTAYSPPIAAYQHFFEQNQGIKIEAYYLAICDMFAGAWVDGRDDFICEEEIDVPPDKRCDLWNLIDEHLDLSNEYEALHENDEDDEEDEE